MQPLTVQIDSMTCGHCVEEITETLKTLNGVHVHSVRVGSATVSFDPRKISTVWIYADIYESEVAATKVGQPATVTFALKMGY
ncbi:MAG: hypothetical protein A4E19_21030 [Nitrospira sp. SG-bin1]|nr:MAG: hypothetical protein A4E19_21030 [Nitrospira sp. SG-bin1]